MKRVFVFSLTSCAALLLLTGVASAQGQFTFGFTASGSDLPAPDIGPPFDTNGHNDIRDDGPDWPAGQLGVADVPEGLTGVQGAYFTTIEQNDPGITEGAQGWQMAWTASGCNGVITAATATQTDLAPGTIEDGERGPGGSGGFDATEITSGSGNDGAVHAIVLHLKKGTTLDPTGSNAKPALGPELNPLTVCRFLVESTNPSPGGASCTLTLAYQDGLQGSGQPIDNKVTQDGQSVVPTVTSATFVKTAEIPPCDQQAGAYGLGFSDTALDTSDYYDAGLAGALGAGGTISVETAPGEVPSAIVYQCITVGSSATSPQGWQLATSLTGAADITSASVAGTSAASATTDGFDSTSIIDAGDNGGTEGFISGIVLSLKKGTTLDELTSATTGTAAVVAITVAGEAAQDASPIAVTLEQSDGLIGGGQAINNRLTIDGNSEEICNSADVIVSFEQGIVDPDFIRGDPNDDSKSNIADAVWVLNEGFRSGPATPCQKAADMNDDGTVDAVVDAAYLISYLFDSGTAPPAPFDACGVDPTADALDCPVGSMTACP